MICVHLHGANGERRDFVDALNRIKAILQDLVPVERVVAFNPFKIHENYLRCALMKRTLTLNTYTAWT